MSIRHPGAGFLIRLAWLVCVPLIPALAAAQQAEPRLGEKEATIEAALAQQTVFDFTDKPLSEVIQFVQRKHEIQVQLDTKALADAGVGTDTTITCNVRDVKLSSALELLLGPLDLTHVVRNEVLAITTKSEAEGILSTKVYPVADLITPSDDVPVTGDAAGI
jgi:general secretion pathway protein D